jgi:hypothetical protein
MGDYLARFVGGLVPSAAGSPIIVGDTRAAYSRGRTVHSIHVLSTSCAFGYRICINRSRARRCYITSLRVHDFNLYISE